MAELYQITHSGNYHLDRNLECQDFTSVKYINDDTIIAVVLDGCSEAIFGKIGAQVAGTAVVDYFTDHVDAEKLNRINDETFGQMVLSIARDSLIQLSNKTSVGIEEFSTTMIAVLIHKEKMFTAHIGDGFVAAVDEDGQTHILSESTNINDDLSMTYFVVDDDAQSHLICKTFSMYKHILISTDGLEKALLDEDYRTIKNAISSLASVSIKNNYELSKCLRGRLEAFMPERLADDFGVVWIKDLLLNDTHIGDSDIDIKITVSDQENKQLRLSTFKRSKKKIVLKFKI